MTKFPQLVAFALIAAVLGGTQCFELCSFLSLERAAKASHQLEPVMPCHQKHAPNDRSPASGEQCSHHEIVAEKLSNASSADQLQAVSFVEVSTDAQIAPFHASSLLTIAGEHFPRFSPLALNSILRI